MQCTLIKGSGRSYADQIAFSAFKETIFLCLINNNKFVFVGAMPMLVATTFCLSNPMRWGFISSYCLLSLWGLYKVSKLYCNY